MKSLRRLRVEKPSEGEETDRVESFSRQVAEGSLAGASEENYRTIFNSAHDGIVVMEPDTGRILDANPKALEMNGYILEEVKGQTFELFCFKERPYTREEAWNWHRKAAEEGPQTFEWKARGKGGPLHWVEINLKRTTIGGRDCILANVRDITDRKRREEELQTSEVKYRHLVEQIPAITHVSAAGDAFTLAYLSPQIEAILGFTPEEWLTDPSLFKRQLHPEDRERVSIKLRRCYAEGKPFSAEYRMLSKDGRVVWLRDESRAVYDSEGRPLFMQGVALDITEHKKAEEALCKVSRALKAVTQCHQALLRATNEAELLSDICRIIVEVGGYRMAWVGLAQQDEEKSIRPVAYEGFEAGYMRNLRLSWADVERGRGPVGTAIRSGKPAIIRDTETDPQFRPWRQEAIKRSYASVLALPLGEAQPFGALAIYAAEADAFDNEEIDLLIGLANDLAYGIQALQTNAERRRAERALRESEQKYYSLMEGASDAIILYDSQGNISEVNQRAVDLLGSSKQELLELNYVQIHPPGILGHVRESFDTTLKTGSGPLHECEVRRKDGRIVPVEISHIMVEYGGRQVIQALFRDVTERQRSEATLRDSEQKLRLLASQLLTVQERERRRVSRELHDELGQALTILKIHLVGIENKLYQDQGEVRASCEQLQAYIDAVIENVRRLSWDLSPSILEDLGLSSSLKYLVAEICRNNQMRYSLTIDEINTLFPPEVKINIYRIVQESLTNIGRHARATRIDLQVKKDKDRVTFLLKDNGIGFNLKEARTRQRGERGLGLTTMNERALMAQGTLSISSRKGKGTDIILTIPIQKEGKRDVPHPAG